MRVRLADTLDPIHLIDSNDEECIGVLVVDAMAACALSIWRAYDDRHDLRGLLAFGPDDGESSLGAVVWPRLEVLLKVNGTLPRHPMMLYLPANVVARSSPESRRRKRRGALVDGNRIVMGPELSFTASNISSAMDNWRRPSSLLCDPIWAETAYYRIHDLDGRRLHKTRWVGPGATGSGMKGAKG